MNSAKQDQQLKQLLKGYRVMTASLKSNLESFGIEVTKRKKHWILKYHGFVFSCPTFSSDCRSGINLAQELIRARKHDVVYTYESENFSYTNCRGYGNNRRLDEILSE